MVTQATITEAVRRLHQAAPGSRVILFGSHARGDARPDSDVDFMVVEPQVTARRAEMVRLNDVLRSLRIPVDVLVTSEETFNRRRLVPGTVWYEAAREGRVYDSQQ